MSMSVEVGKKYGRFTVMAEAGKKYSWTRYYTCRCECGNVADYPVSVIMNKPNRYCRKCAPHTGGHPKPDFAGKTINGWEVLEDYTYKNGVYFFKCRCVRCGNVSIRSAGQIRLHKTERCENCPPMYNFRIDGDYAYGSLPNGETFIIDTGAIPLVEKYYWQDGKEKYIVSKRTGIKLHRLIAGVDDRNVMVDHINRNRRDCRRENLRIITPFGNSCNHKLFRTNKTGYTGVYFSRATGRYEVKVGYNHKRILLGTSPDDLITLAQMYNIGAQFFFGEYIGELNDVPSPSEDLIQRVIAKCQKYKEAPAATAGASVA